MGCATRPYRLSLAMLIASGVSLLLSSSAAGWQAPPLRPDSIPNIARRETPRSPTPAQTPTLAPRVVNGPSEPGSPAPASPAPRSEAPSSALRTASKNEPVVGGPTPEPSPDPALEPLVDVEPIKIDPAGFNGVAPGRTTLDALTKAWGEPAGISNTGEGRVLSFHIQPFKQIDVTLTDNVVAFLVVHLERPLSPERAMEQLRLKNARTAEVLDADGTLLGEVFPERGVVFSYEGPGAEQLVGHILVEPIHAEPFILRAEQDALHHYRQRLVDLDFAIKLDPSRGKSHYLKAKVLAATGRFDEALTSLSQAVRVAPENMQYRLCAAAVSAEIDQYETALDQVRAILDRNDLAPLDRAEGECLLGDLLAGGPDADFKSAMDHHQRAIELSSKLSNSEHQAERRRAKRLLLEAHWAITKNIAWGNWQRKEEVVPRWLSRCEAIVENLLKEEAGDSMLRLQMAAKTLEVYVGVQGSYDPTNHGDASIQAARALVTESGDPLFQRQVTWLLGTAMVDALRIERQHGHHQQATRYAQNAITLLEKAAGHRQQTPALNYAMGRLYFLNGALLAAYKNDHQNAAVWYDKSTPRLSQPMPYSALSEIGQQGEWLVSMGVTYWKVGRQELAVQLTEHGSKLMQRSVDKGMLPPDSMNVPFGNLASMHRKLGHATEAEKYSKLAGALQSATRPTPAGASPKR